MFHNQGVALHRQGDWAGHWGSDDHLHLHVRSGFEIHCWWAGRYQKIYVTQELALATYNNQEYQGKTITVSPSIVKQHMAVPIVAPSRGRDRGRGRGGGRGAGERGRGGRGQGGQRGRGGVHGRGSKGWSTGKSFSDQSSRAESGRDRGTPLITGASNSHEGGYRSWGSQEGLHGGNRRYDHGVGGYDRGSGGTDHRSGIGGQISGAYGNHGSGGYFQLGGRDADYGQGQGGYVQQAGPGYMGAGNLRQDFWQASHVGPMRSGYGGQQLPPQENYRHFPY